MMGGAVMAGRASGRRKQQEQDMEMQQQQQYAAPPPPPPQAAPPPAAAPGSDLVSQIKQLSDLKAAGALTDAEFEAAKQKLLAG
jgi:hypothetical protein